MANENSIPVVPNKLCPLPAGSKVFTYARDSGGESQERSVDEQIRLYDAYAEQHGLIVLRHFHDRARPGSSMIGRKGLEDLLQESARRPTAAAGILFWSMSRLSRDQLESQFLKATLRRNGMQLVFLADDIPEAGDLSYVFESLIEWKDTQDLKTISRNARRGLADLVASRKKDGSFEGFAPGIPPRGFKGEPVAIGVKRTGEPRMVQRWIPDPRWWRTCRQAWELRAGGWSIADIHRKLRIYQASTCYTTFYRNPIYKGEFHFGGAVLKDFVPRMVADDIWKKVQQLQAPLRKHSPARADSDRLFAGLAFCGRCGAAMKGFGYRRGGVLKYRYYACTGRARGTCDAPMVPTEPFETRVVELLTSRILNEPSLRTLLEKYRDAVRNRSGAAEEEIAGLSEELAAAERTVERVVKSIEKAPLSDALAGALTDAERRAAEIRARIADLQSDARRTKTLPDYSSIDLQVLAEKLKRSLSTRTPEGRSVLRGFIRRIELERKRAVIYYNFPMEGAADPGGAFRLTSARSPVGALAEVRLEVNWTLRPESKQDRNAV